MTSFRLFLLLIGGYKISIAESNTVCPIDNAAVKKIREYLQIDTSLKTNIDAAVEFWRQQAKDIGLDFAVYRPVIEPICVITWRGTNSSLPSIMLNAHMDVVPADSVKWSYPPFAAHVDENCNIYGRGSQDCKDTAIQYLEAISRLKQKDVALQRTVHITLMPDEETGGFRGMRSFLKTDEFKLLNVGFALDEGLSSSGDYLYVMYQDRRAWSMNFTVEGTGAHGFVMPHDIALKKLLILLQAIMEFREPLEQAVSSKTPLEYGYFTTININMINGGLAHNIIPSTFNVVADLRLSPTENATEILNVVNSWLKRAGNGTKVQYLRREMVSLATPLDNSNRFWEAMKKSIEEMGFNIRPIVNPATSDIIFVRNQHIPAIGFSPKYRTASKIHTPNEYVNIHTFLRGIDVYENIIGRIANVPGL